MARVSVVIATRNRPQLLRESIESILSGDHLPDEIVVADQSPDASTLPVHDRVNVRHLRLDSVGMSRACNAAVRAAAHPVLVFTHDDVVVERDWLRRIVERLLAGPPRCVVTGAVLPLAESGFVPSVTQRTEPEVFSGRLFADVLFPNNMALRRDVFDEIGLLDERLGPGTAFPAAEDNDLGYRLLEAGYEIAFAPEAIVHHRGARSGRELAALDWGYARGQGAFYAKHMRRGDRHMLRRFGRNVMFRLKRMPPLVLGNRGALREAIYLGGLVSGAVGWWRRYGWRAR